MMIRKALLAFTMVAMAAGCGGSDKEASTADHSAPAVAAKEPGMAADAVNNAVAKAAEVSGCMDLVGQKNWVAAVDACTKAAGVAPQNQQVQDALKSAQQGLAASTVANAEKAAGDAANSAAQDATKGLLNMGK